MDIKKADYQAQINKYESRGYKKSATPEEKPIKDWQRIGTWTKELKGYHRFQLGLKNFLITFFTAGLGLLDKNLRSSWQEVASGKQIRTIYAPEGTDKRVDHLAQPLKPAKAESEPKKLEDQIQVGSTTISLRWVDMFKAGTELVVNAANRQLAAGGGVCGAVRNQAGAEVFAECKALRPQGVKDGQAVLTSAGTLPNSIKGIVHTVGPSIPEGKTPTEEDKKGLAAAYRSALELAIGEGEAGSRSPVVAASSFRSIAFPSISTGIFGYPAKEAAAIALKTICDFAKDHPGKLDRIEICFVTPTISAYHAAMQEQKSVLGAS